MREPVLMDDWDMDEPRPREQGVFWPAWLWPLLVWMPLDAWHERFARDLPRLGLAAREGALPGPATLAWFATGVVLAAALVEALFYGMLWRARGRRLPVLAATVAVVLAGVLELLALRVTDAAPPGADAWRVALAGARALASRETGAFAAAFGGFGLLALTRWVLFAGLQAGLVRCRFREAFVLTCATWLASHVAQWWLLELVVGRGVFERWPVR